MFSAAFAPNAQLGNLWRPPAVRRSLRFWLETQRPAHRRSNEARAMHLGLSTGLSFLPSGVFEALCSLCLWLSETKRTTTISRGPKKRRSTHLFEQVPELCHMLRSSETELKRQRATSLVEERTPLAFGQNFGCEVLGRYLDPRQKIVSKTHGDSFGATDSPCFVFFVFFFPFRVG